MCQGVAGREGAGTLGCTSGVECVVAETRQICSFTWRIPAIKGAERLARSAPFPQNITARVSWL